MDGLKIMEGISGFWHYHLGDGSLTALCGARVMPTGKPVSQYGKTPPNYHIPETWCEICKKESTPDEK